MLFYDVTILEVDVYFKNLNSLKLYKLESSQNMGASDGQLSYNNPLNQSMLYNTVDTSINYDPRTATYSTRGNNYPPQVPSSSSNFPNYRQNAETGKL